MADGAVDVLDRATRAAHQMMVVVPDASLKACGASGRLEAAYQAALGEHAEHHVDGLRGNAPQTAAGGDCDLLDIEMISLTHRCEHSQTRSGHAQARVPKPREIAIMTEVSGVWLHCSGLHCSGLYGSELSCSELRCTGLRRTGLRCTGLHGTSLAFHLRRDSNLRIIQLLE